FVISAPPNGVYLIFSFVWYKENSADCPEGTKPRTVVFVIAGCTDSVYSMPPIFWVERMRVLACPQLRRLYETLFSRSSSNLCQHRLKWNLIHRKERNRQEGVHRRRQPCLLRLDLEITPVCGRVCCSCADTIVFSTESCGGWWNGVNPAYVEWRAKQDQSL